MAPDVGAEARHAARRAGAAVGDDRGVAKLHALRRGRVRDVGGQGARAVAPRGFQGYWLKDTVKGPQFEESKTQILLNHKVIEEDQNDS